MPQGEIDILKVHYQSLLGIKEAIKIREQITQGFIERAPVIILQQEIDALMKLSFLELPGIDWARHTISDGYNSISILAYLDVVLARLRVALERVEQPSSVTGREFPYIKDNKLKTIVERDYIDLQKCLLRECWKAVIILTGGCVEAILMDALLQSEGKAKALPDAPKDKLNGNVKEIRDWGFVHLILAATKLGIVNPGVEKLSHSLRDYRDLVHPSVEIRSKLKPNEEEAKIALAVLDMLHRDLLSILQNAN